MVRGLIKILAEQPCPRTVKTCSGWLPPGRHPQQDLLTGSCYTPERTAARFETRRISDQRRCPGNMMPVRQTFRAAETSSASPEKICSSAIDTDVDFVGSHRAVAPFASGACRGKKYVNRAWAKHYLRVLSLLTKASVDRTDHVESPVQVVLFASAVNNHLKAANLFPSSGTYHFGAPNATLTSSNVE